MLVQTTGTTSDFGFDSKSFFHQWICDYITKGTDITDNFNFSMDCELEKSYDYLIKRFRVGVEMHYGVVFDDDNKKKFLEILEQELTEQVDDWRCR